MNVGAVLADELRLVTAAVEAGLGRQSCKVTANCIRVAAVAPEMGDVPKLQTVKDIEKT